MGEPIKGNFTSSFDGGIDVQLIFLVSIDFGSPLKPFGQHL